MVIIHRSFVGRDRMRIAFIGGGKMAEAIIGGLIKARAVEPANISVGEPIQERAAHLRETYGVQTTNNNRFCISLKW